MFRLNRLTDYAVVVMSQMAVRSGETRSAQQISEDTGVPLPSESSGRLSTPALREKMNEERPDLFPEGRWFTGDNVSLAIGQGELTVTPIQIANAYATYGNGGTYDAEAAKVVLDRLVVEAGVIPYFFTQVADVIREGDRLVGVIVETKEGRAVIHARMIVDSSGDGDVCARAGVPR